MSIVTTADLAAFMGTTLVSAQAQAALDIAEQLVANTLGMVETDGLGLSRREDVEKTFWVKSDARAIEVPTGPIEAVSICLVDGVEKVADIELRSPWKLGFSEASGLDFARGSRIDLTCDIGYVEVGAGAGVEIPAAVSNAVLVQASGIYTNISALATGSIKSSESIGDYSVSWAVQAGQTVTTVSPLVPQLLRTLWRTPYVGA